MVRLLVHAPLAPDSVFQEKLTECLWRLWRLVHQHFIFCINTERQPKSNLWWRSKTPHKRTLWNVLETLVCRGKNLQHRVTPMEQGNKSNLWQTFLVNCYITIWEHCVVKFHVHCLHLSGLFFPFINNQIECVHPKVFKTEYFQRQLKNCVLSCCGPLCTVASSFQLSLFPSSEWRTPASWPFKPLHPHKGV